MGENPDPIARYIAGSSMTEALDRARLLNKEGIGTLLVPLECDSGEESFERRVDDLKEMSRQMGMKMIRGGISVRLSDFGFRVHPDKALERLVRVIRSAEEYALAIWIDMEEPETVSPTLDAYLDLRKKFPHLSITLQSRLDRTSADLRRVIGARGRVRLVKGEYADPSGKSANDPDEIRRRYRGDMELLFSEGAMFAIATHDEQILEGASKLQKNHPRMMEFQMYLGVREDRIRSLLFEGGFPVTLYLPFGSSPDRYFRRTGVKAVSESL
ncbi:MAG: proline dehydrogenase family protein [Nitrospirae bacterium]|nr:proline dehydrogenase family protein [Nitrospirota bacterium]